MPFHIAIDGPVAAGKGTVSKLVSDKLKFLYIDTGAMYRMAALLALEKKVNWEDEKNLAKILKTTQMDLRMPEGEEEDGRLITALLNTQDVSWQIRTEKIGQGASIVSQFPQVRKILVKKQQQIAKNKNVVMEGRDITHNVLPNANLKIFLTADPNIRAKRRHQQLLEKGENISFAKVYEMMQDRDNREMNRKTNPLKIVKDAWVLNTDELTIEQVVELIVNKVTKYG